VRTRTTAIELINTASINLPKLFSFTQRVRFGLKMNEYQFGMAADFSNASRNQYITNNIGVFLRYEF
jgi:hypothetical protein